VREDQRCILAALYFCNHCYLMQPYTVTEHGEKVLAGSRRPDGTIRKERRIRAGYTPQDEQPTYQSTGAMVRAYRH
jgi:hypothetical protein